MRIIRTCFVLLIFFWYEILTGQNSQIQKEYEIQYGSNPNIESGTESVLELSSLGFTQVNRSIEKNINNRGLKIISRLTNFMIVQLYAGGLFYGTFLHEYFGHKLRADEFGLPLTLDYNFPGLGGDFTFPVDYNVPAIERQMVVASGFEATSLLAHKAIQQLYSGEPVASYIGLYMLSGKLIEGILTVQNDIKPFLDDPNDYYANDFRLSRNPTPNDPLAYLLALTENYGYYDDFISEDELWVQRQPDMAVYTQNNFIHDQNKRIKRAFLLSALDPALLYFFYGSYAYLVQGKTFVNPFMFKVKQVSFMPSIRANYGELGAENYFDLHFNPEALPAFNVYYRSGGNMFDSINGAGLEVRKYRYKQIAVGLQLDYWHNSREETHKGNFYLKTAYSFPTNSIILSTGLGYKSQGGLMGKPLAEGFYGNIGLGLKLKYNVD